MSQGSRCSRTHSLHDTPSIILYLFLLHSLPHLSFPSASSSPSHTLMLFSLSHPLIFPSPSLSPYLPPAATGKWDIHGRGSDRGEEKFKAHREIIYLRAGQSKTQRPPHRASDYTKLALMHVSDKGSCTGPHPSLLTSRDSPLEIPTKIQCFHPVFFFSLCFTLCFYPLYTLSALKLKASPCLSDRLYPLRPEKRDLMARNYLGKQGAKQVIDFRFRVFH